MLFALVRPVPGRAESLTLEDLGTDAKLYFTAPLRWDGTDWLYFGGAIAAVAAAHAFDGDVRRHFVDADPQLAHNTDTHDLRDILPTVAVIAGTWAVGSFEDESAGRVEAYSMIEAAGLSTVTSEVLKYATGRERPDQTDHVNVWGAGGGSFPSLHASAAFAVGTVLAESGGEDYRWLRRFLGYGMAAATAYIRVRDNAHWLSDTVAGAAIGTATGRFVVNRRDARAEEKGWRAEVLPAPGGGITIAVTRRFSP